MAGKLVFITGATGFIGFASLLSALQAGYVVRVSVRRESQIAELLTNTHLQPFTSQLSFVVVPDITVPGAFDEALKDVVYVLHIASKIPFPTSDPEADIIYPAINGTLSILTSALLHPTIRRIVITSSNAALLPSSADFTPGTTTITSSSRVSPLPTGPYDIGSAYRASKILALDATERFLASHHPHYAVVNLMPGYVLGRSAIARQAEDLKAGSNGLVMGLLLGEARFGPSALAAAVDIKDVARIHVAALDEEKVVVGEGESKGFVLDNGWISFDAAKEIVRRAFPKAVKDGVFSLSRSLEDVHQSFDTSDTVAAFGELGSYEDSVKSVAGQYIELKA